MRKHSFVKSHFCCFQIYVKHATLLLNRTFFFRSEKLTMLLFCRILCNAYQIFSVTETKKFYRFYIADGDVSNVYKMSANIDKNKSKLGKKTKKKFVMH